MSKPEGTSHTFYTLDEAQAFMLGFVLGRTEGIEIIQDHEEPECILVDFDDDEAEGEYMAIRESHRAAGGY